MMLLLSHTHFAVLFVNVCSVTVSIGCGSLCRTLSFSWQVRMVQQGATVPLVLLLNTFRLHGVAAQCSLQQ